MTESQVQESQVSAGEQLKHLREQKNLSVQDIASRLNLEARIIQAIEQNNFELLPAATYARGYIRSYAKIVGIDPEEVISAYNNDAPEPPEIIPEVKHPTQTSSSDKPVRAFTYLVTLTLVILLVAWLYSNFVVDKMSAIGIDASEDEGPPSALSYEIPVVEHSPLPFYRSEDALETEDDIPASGDTLDLESALTTEEPAQEIFEDNGVITYTDDGDEYPLLVTTDNDGPDSLVLNISRDSWIEIFDSLDNKVFVNLAHKGQVLNLKGTAPFTVVLGFSEGVTIELNGESFDAGPYTKGSIARFSLDN